MATNKPRVNITLNEEIAVVLKKIAAKEGKTVSGLSKDMILHSLELREDMALSKLAESLDDRTENLYSHQDAWK
jgi:predicted DNA-binding protein